MIGETSLSKLTRNMKPILNEGDYVFVTTKNLNQIDRIKTILEFKEAEGTTVILTKNVADQLNLSYEFITSWITLSVHSSLNAVGFTALFSTALAKNGISCNVVAGYYHDHIFVNKKNEKQTMKILENLAHSVK